MLADIFFGVFGLAVLLGIAWLFSAQRDKVQWRIVGLGIALQLIFALLVLRTSWGKGLFEGLSRVFVKVIDFTQVGAQFIFGPLTSIDNFGFIFAIQVLPTIIFFASLMSVLYHLGLMQRIVQAMAWVMTRILGVSGAESLSVAANVFVGQTEAPLVVRPYIARMTQSELFTTMVGGMATIAGGVLAAYVGLLGGTDPERKLYFATHLLSASIMAAPATIVISKLLQPEREDSLTKGNVKLHVERTSNNVIEAAANGASDGVSLAINVGGMLLAFIALIAMVNYPLQALGEVLGLQESLGRPLDLSLVLGWILSPIAWVIGVPWGDAVTVGGLIGQKIITNEFVAYSQFNDVKAGLSDKAILITTYALCGFANLSSIAIQLGGIGGMAPERKSHIAALGLKAVLGGTLVTLMTATIAGVITGL